MALNKEKVLFWNEVENVLYEEDGYQFVVVFDLFNNHEYFYCRKDDYEIDLKESPRDDIYDAIDRFNKIILSGDYWYSATPERSSL